MLNINLPEEIPPTRSVFVAKVNKKMYIGKTSNLEWLAAELKNTYGKYTRLGIPENNLFYPLLKYYHESGAEEMKIDVLFYSEKGYDILKFELEQLQDHFGKAYCLNKNHIPHIPKTIRAIKGSNWLTEADRMNFAKLLHRANA
jgi:hypothetical protein